MSQIAIIGGGLAGVTAAWQLHQLGRAFTLYEASPRLGGTVRTLHREGFIIDLGPDGWVTEKPWAAELVRDLGLEHELTPSLDADRVTWILRHGCLVAMPDGMRMMVPTELAALERSPLFSPEARAAYAAEPARAEELRAQAVASGQPDESVAAFVLRHFGNEVLDTIAAPLLAGVFGGNVWNLSVQAVMPRFVEMERTHGSLIVALQSIAARTGSPPAIFTTLASGTQTLIDRMAAALPAESIHLNSPVRGIIADGGPWILDSPHGPGQYHACNHVILATPAHITRDLLPGLIADTHGLQADERAPHLLPTESTSAILVALAFEEFFDLPKGFGFLVPPGESSRLLAATFVDQKFPGRVPPGASAPSTRPAKRLLRAFFGGPSALALIAQDDSTLSALALAELEKILGPLPTPIFSAVQRWPLSLPQYAVGHLDRITELNRLTPRGIHLLGNAYRGVGLPDLIRHARALARSLA